jgi:hypothetical protein
MTARSNAWFCCRSLDETVGSTPSEVMVVCLLSVLYAVRYRSLRRTDHSSREVLASVVCLSVIAKP